MVVSPSLAEDLAFLVQLALQVVTEILEASLELLLEVVEHVVNVVHGLHSLLLVLLDLTARMQIRLVRQTELLTYV